MRVELIDPWRERSGNEAQAGGQDMDLCSQEGSAALAKRLRKYWQERGEDRHYQARHVATDESGHVVWGVKEVAPVVHAAPGVIGVGKCPSIELRVAPEVVELLTSVLKERHPGVLLSEIDGRGKMGRLDATASAARRDCVRSLKKHFGWGQNRIARLLGVDNSTVSYAFKEGAV